MSRRNKQHLSVRIDATTAAEIETIERHLKADPKFRLVLRHYDDGYSRGQVVRWAISRAAETLEGAKG